MTRKKNRAIGSVPAGLRAAPAGIDILGADGPLARGGVLSKLTQPFGEDRLASIFLATLAV
jgi:hypothetical protein